ncbi:MAG: hypothetical protein R2705_14600 [Ilumatobacteraceae bacterium]
MATEEPRRDPWDQLLDVALYVPLGVLAALREDGAKLAQRGRNEAAVAKMIGSFAVTQARKELERRLASFTAPTGDSPNQAVPDERVAAEPVSAERVPAEPARAPGTTATSSTKQGSKRAGSSSKRRSSSPVAPVASELPIESYDELAASHVVARLAGLTPDELDAVERYESAHRARRTVLGKIGQLRSAS